MRQPQWDRSPPTKYKTFRSSGLSLGGRPEQQKRAHVSGDVGTQLKAEESHHPVLTKSQDKSGIPMYEAGCARRSVLNER